MLSSCNFGDKVLHGLCHWEKLGRPRRIQYIIRHGAACLYYVYWCFIFFPHFQWRHLPAAQDVLCFFRNFEQPLLKFQAQLDRHSAEPRPENRRQGSLLSNVLKAFKLLDLLTRPPWSRSWRSATVPPDDPSWRSASSEKMWYFKSAQRYWWIDWWHLDLLLEWLIDWSIDWLINWWIEKFFERLIDMELPIVEDNCLRRHHLIV